MQSTLRRVIGSSVAASSQLLAVLGALLVVAVILALLGANPITGYAALLEGAFGGSFAITQTLVKATPLLLVGLGVCIAFRGGVLNIGGEGQLIVGGLASTAVLVGMAGAPGILAIPLGLLAGAVAGAAWGGVPGFLKARLGVNEILSTIMMNFIAVRLSSFLLRGVMIDPEQVVARTFLPQSARIPDEFWLPRLLPPTLLHAGALLAVVLAVGVFVLLWRTVLGYRIRAVGQNADAARFAGITVPVHQMLALVLGGAFAGLAGAVEVMGVSHRMMEGVGTGYGFDGIIAALFGKLHPLATIPSSILFGALLVGADKMQRAVQVPSDIVQILLGLVVLFVVSAEILAKRRKK